MADPAVAPSTTTAVDAVATSAAAAPTAPGERPKIGDTRPAIGDTRSAPAGSAAPAPTQAPSRSGGGRNRNRSGGGGGGGGARSGGSASATAATASDGRTAGSTPRSAQPTAKSETGTRGEGRRGGRERRGKAVGRYQICVHVRPEMTQIALLEGRTLVEHYISRASDDAIQIDGNIYRGRVQNVLPGMEAAFVDIGTPKNAVLYHGDVRYDTDDVESGKGGGQPRIEQLLKPGQTILCQVTKNPIGAKGARLTQEVSLPGRFVVLVPNSTAYGISKRLEDAERKRLRRIVDAVRPEGHGVIVRTAAAGASAEELEHDIQRLVEQWDAIASASLKGQGASLLYREPAIAVRVIREELNREYRAVVIDDLALYEQVRDYVGAVNPELADRVEYYDPEVEALPIFERFHVHEQLHKALDRKVFLPSGGSLVIDRTEALTVIDVNTGKNVGTTNLEETVYRNNLEAADEVARQLRLRDIGGIIVIDFIDMEIRENRDKVGAALRTALARDKTRTQVFDISELGLVEMTRKRVSEGLIESMSTTCELCQGRGIVFDDPEL
jgi:ribonuclease E